LKQFSYGVAKGIFLEELYGYIIQSGKQIVVQVH